MATGDMHRRLGKVWICGLFEIYEPTDRQTDTLTAILCTPAIKYSISYFIHV